ncbi:MAG TPA: SBBP repeat-containing protein [Pyrinomonadaceae bacterium]|jgi:hypothetical protein
MPRLPKRAAYAGALLCAALLAQFPESSAARRVVVAAARETPRHAARDSAGAHAAPDFGRLPLTFEANRGQAAPGVKYLARGAGYTLTLGRDGARLSLKSGAATLRMSFPGASREARPVGLDVTEAVSNYLRGRDPSKWVTGVENYARVGYAGMYEGVDLVFHGTGGRLEYDFLVAPGADASRVQVRFDGAGRARLDADGALVLPTRAGEVRHPRPVAYQGEGGARTYVACDYALSRSGVVGFRLGGYDRARTLVIDPMFVYSTYLGGSSFSGGVAVDAAGNAYVVGQRGPNGDVIVQKLNPAGTGLVYSTQVGGSKLDTGHAVALDAAGNAYVTGTTSSPDFPVSSSAFDKTCGNNGTCNDLGSGTQSDGFVFKLNPAGSALVYSTYLGGSGAEPIPGQPSWPVTPQTDIAVDAGGNAYVSGSTSSQDFPTTPGAFRTTPGASFITKLNPTGSALAYSTYFPGAVAQAVVIDAAGGAYITGMTTTSDSNPPALPVVNAYQPTLGGAFTFDAFAAKLNPEGSALVFSTFLGGPEGAGDTPRGGDDAGHDIGIDAAGNVYVTGTTRSGCFPSANPYVPPSGCANGGAPKEFLVKFAPAGDTLLFSKKLTTGASADGALSVSPSGLSTVAWSCQTKKVFDVCVNRESSSGVTLYTASFGGKNVEWVAGVAADDAGQFYVAGHTVSDDYPTTPGAFAPAIGPSINSFAAKLSAASPVAQFGGGSPLYTYAVYQAAEGAGKVTVRVERSGDLTRAFSVGYETIDGTARSTSDYAAAAGTFDFAPFETAKTFDVFITDDAYGPEGDESFVVRLLNPTNGAALGGESVAAVLIADNDAANGPNPVAPPGFDADFFVRQHYIDFLSREPDAEGLAFWKGELTGCGADAACLEVKRINVSAAFFLSIEFQETGYFVYRAYMAAYQDASSPGVPVRVPVIRLREFVTDARRVGAGVVVGPGDEWKAQLEANKDAYVREFVQRQRFFDHFPAALSAEQFVNKLDAHAPGVLSQAERAQLIAELSPSPADPALRASVLRKYVEDADLKRREFNRAFVLMEYFGYLRRNPDDAPEPTLNYAGWKFWLDKLEAFGGDYVRAEMVKAFLDSAEYRQRFGP